MTIKTLQKKGKINKEIADSLSDAMKLIMENSKEPKKQDTPELASKIEAGKIGVFTALNMCPSSENVTIVTPSIGAEIPVHKIVVKPQLDEESEKSSRINGYYLTLLKVRNEASDIKEFDKVFKEIDELATIL
jgi:hypothetical protein